jgi:hypothetical protein
MSHFYHTEQSPILRIFGDHAARVAVFLRLNPPLLQRIAFAPRPAIHAIGAFLHLSPEALRPDATVAAILDQRDPRELLRCAIPNAPLKLYRALDRAGDAVHEKSYYERLATLCSGPLSDFLLSGESLNPRRLDRLEALLEMDRVILKWRGIWDQQLREIEAVNAIIIFLRVHRAFDEAEFRLPAGAGLPAILRRLQKALDQIEAPTPSFSLPPPFRIIRTVRELRDVGKVLSNCVRHLRSFGTDHWFRLASGEVIYIFADAPPMLAALQQVGPELWYLDEVEGSQNTDVLSDVKEMITSALSKAGVRLVRENPAYALRALGTGQSLIDCEDDPGAVLEDLDAGRTA